MALTEEQRRRIEENRKRALEIKKQKQLERVENAKKMGVLESSAPPGGGIFDEGGFVGGSSTSLSGEIVSQSSKKRKIESGGGAKGSGEGNAYAAQSSTHAATDDASDDESSLEDFERDASLYISQTEAQKTYCIPMGTLAVCSYVEKDNPHKKGWNKMKLYLRSEVRRRARRRFGGKQGLIDEREKRRKKRFEKDMKETKDVFG